MFVCRLLLPSLLLISSSSKHKVSSFRIPTPSLHRSSTFITTTKTKMMSSKTTPEASKINTGRVSSQIQETLDPCVVLMKQIISKYDQLWKDEKKEEIFSLAQGVVYWSPPETTNEYLINALVGSDESATASNELNQSTLHLYGPVEGSSDLLEKLQEKLKKENGLDDVSIMVTAGANQAYMNCVLTLFSNDESDKGVIFKPYYFNHGKFELILLSYYIRTLHTPSEPFFFLNMQKVMAIQMARGNDALIYGPTTPNEGIPDTQWLEEELSVSSNNIKVVTVVNPGNPTGVSLSRTKIQELVDICGKYSVWLILDNTYEHFDHSNANSNNASNDDDVPFYCPSEPHVINIFSFSKCFSLAGYRVGYLTISNQNYEVFEQMKKVSFNNLSFLSCLLFNMQACILTSKTFYCCDRFKIQSLYVFLVYLKLQLLEQSNLEEIGSMKK